MTKRHYKEGFESKRRAREFLFNMFPQHDTLVGLAGPSIKQYADWCKQKGFVNITSYEYNERVYRNQYVLNRYHDLGISVKMGSIGRAPIEEGVLYDIDLCDSLKSDSNKELLTKFKDVPFVLTACERGFSRKDTIKTLIKHAIHTRKDSVLSTSKVPGKAFGLGGVDVYVLSTKKGSEYVILPYKDRNSPPMICIAKTN